ncbi:MAG TPA: PLP-dependent aminotransferase family protein [Crinalium sp.]|jgi:GntR family transcriptional regulator/MocR family aminotransferase
MDFVITLSDHALLPLHRQLYEELRRAILTGRLSPRQRIPSTRALAKSLGISRATVTLSYEQLLSEGYLETAMGSGTFVCAQLPDDLLQSGPVVDDRPSTPRSIQLSTYGATLTSAELIRLPDPALAINFSYGRPAFDQFPMDLWRRLVSRYCHLNPDMMDYATDSGGYFPLREAIARYLSRARAVQCDPQQVIIINGSQQALDLMTRLLVNRDDRVALENPGYLGARRTFLAYGACLCPVPVDASGMVVSDLTAIPDVKLVYVTPSHQFPTGAVLSLPRRLELLAWAQKTGAVILEDDYDSEYRYGGRSATQDNRPIPALQGLDTGSSVIYIGTFSKVLFPALRLGYLVVPPNLVDLVIRAKWLSDRQSPLLEQYVLTDFINEGHLERHIRRMRSLYDQRRHCLVHALTTQLQHRVTILGENAGIHVMVKFHTDLTDAEILSRAAQVDVGLTSAHPYYLNGGASGEFIFGYSELSEPQILEGMRRLASVL